MKYEVVTHEKEPKENGFMACLAIAPLLPPGEKYSPDVEEFTVHTAERTKDGFKWCAFNGDVADWRNPIGNAFLAMDATVNQWVWMTLHDVKEEEA